MILVLWR